MKVETLNQSIIKTKTLYNQLRQRSKTHLDRILGKNLFKILI